MTLAEWGNPTALFSYRLKRLSTVEIRAGCRFWVTAQAEPAPGTGKGHSPRRGCQESGSSAEKTLHANPRPRHFRKNYRYAGMLFSVGLLF
jgi:hypothetical protein